MSLAIPALLFIWFIFAFLNEGSAYKSERARYEPYHVERSKLMMPVQEEHDPNVTHQMESPKPESTPETK